MSEPERILVRSTVNLPGLRVGAYALVDPDDPYMAELLDTEILVAEEPHADE